MHRLRLARLLLTLLLGLGLVAGCAPRSGSESPSTQAPTAPPRGLPAADSTVAALGDALAAMDLSAVPLVGVTPAEAQAELEVIFSGMDGLVPTVELESIEYSEDEDTAIANVAHHYGIGVAGWDFNTRVPLLYDGTKWQVSWSPQVIHPDLTSESRLRHRRSLPKRAPINDNQGVALVEERTLYQVGLDKGRIDEADWATAATDLAEILDIDPAAYAQRVLAGGPKQFVVAVTVPQEQIDPAIDQVPGVHVAETTGMVSPSPTFALSLLGTRGRPTAETVEESDGDVWAFDTVGLSGLQARYEDRLRGVPEVLVELVGRTPASEVQPGEEFEVQVLFHQAASVGDPLQLSLDRGLQTRAEEVLESQEGIASLVVIRPSDGALLAAANSPAAGGYPQATFGKFAPGSTFKVVSALAMLREGMTPGTMVDCPSSLDVSGHVFGNYSDYPASQLGRISLTSALAHSCNTAFVAAARDVTAEELHSAAGSLGVGTDYDAGFTSYFGTVEPRASAIDRGASMIGQGQITMSPLGMATVAASVAGGKTVIPWLVEGEQAQSTAAPLTEQEAGDLQDMMTAVVTEGSGRVLSSIMTGAKTGTAEFGTEGNYQTHAWMIAWNQDYAVASFVEVGRSGSATAAPLILELFS